MIRLFTIAPTLVKPWSLHHPFVKFNKQKKIKKTCLHWPETVLEQYERTLYIQTVVTIVKTVTIVTLVTVVNLYWNKHCKKFYQQEALCRICWAMVLCHIGQCFDSRPRAHIILLLSEQRTNSVEQFILNISRGLSSSSKYCAISALFTGR